MKLLFDQGNTNLRWATVSEGGHFVPGGVLPAGEPLIAGLRRIRESTPDSVLAVIVSSVGSAARDVDLSGAVLTVFGCRPVFLAAEAQSCGLVNGYTDPGRLGVDRWLDMLGARSTNREPLLVVDAGSAVTLDAVSPAGKHLGGFIVPGFSMQCNALGSTTARVGVSRAAPGSGWGRDTESAVANGVLLGLAGLIERSLEEMQQGVAERCTLVLTGGDAHRIAPLLKADYFFDEYLLFRGMIVRLGAGGFRST